MSETISDRTTSLDDLSGIARVEWREAGWETTGGGEVMRIAGLGLRAWSGWGQEGD